MTTKNQPSSKKVYVPKKITPAEKKIFRLWSQDAKPVKKAKNES